MKVKIIQIAAIIISFIIAYDIGYNLYRMALLDMPFTDLSKLFMWSYLGLGYATVSIVKYSTEVLGRGE